MGTYTAPPLQVEVEKNAWPNMRMFLVENWTGTNVALAGLDEKSMIMHATDNADNTIIVDVNKGVILEQYNSSFSGFNQYIPDDRPQSVLNKYFVYLDYTLNKISVWKRGKLTYIIDFPPLQVDRIMMSRSGKYVYWYEIVGSGKEWWIAF